LPALAPATTCAGARQLFVAASTGTWSWVLYFWVWQ
jgi:hypothetical protein